MHAVPLWRNLMVRDGALACWDLQADRREIDEYDWTHRGRHGVRQINVTRGGQGPGRGTRSRWSNSDARFDVAHGSWMDVQQLTVEMWFRSDGDQAVTRGLMGRDPGSGNPDRPWVVQLTSTGAVEAYSDNALGPVQGTTRTGLDDSRWHYFAWAYDASTGNGSHYLDGALDNSYSGGGALATTTDDLEIMRQSTSSNAWLGWMAFVGFFGQVLTAAQVRAHHDVVARHLVRAP